ncbi:MAG: bifunctional diguanylate cyclase/phosphodiesterase [Treponema sp.]|nr:bifunctional diguanylate cyclase/phosphodiesterase [Treponema sp.]
MEYIQQTSVSNFFIICNLKKRTFTFSKDAEAFFPEGLKPSYDISFAKDLLENGFADQATANVVYQAFNEVVQSKEVKSISREIQIKNRQGNSGWFRLDFLLADPGKRLILTFNNISEKIQYFNHLSRLLDYDELTGLYTRSAFKHKVDRVTQPYAILYFDIWHFKAINDTYGRAGGDLLLIHIADVLRRLLNNESNGFAERIVADRFAVLVYTDKVYIEQFTTNLVKEIKDYDLNFHIVCNVGIYINEPEKNLPAYAKVDRALTAQEIIKGSYTKTFNYYSENLTENLVNEQSLTSSMLDALDNNQFILYYQPQYSHITGKIVGAEALVRWVHPDLGFISPAQFIPVFEKNNFITTLDMYVFEQACKFIRKCMNQGIPIVPISTNFSRYDVIEPDFVERLEECRSIYNVPIEKIRVEITETAVVEGSAYISSVVNKLQEHGYIVEMDDFGSGYSSLNVLKDINFDIIKLDMRFMSNKEKNERGSTILSSVVGMSTKLHMAIIAEGVETELQADFLRDIGCEIIQGYYYSKPIPENDFLEKLKNN